MTCGDEAHCATACDEEDCNCNYCTCDNCGWPTMPFAKWGHGRAMPKAEPDSRWIGRGMVSDDSELYNKVNNENPERKG